MIQSLGVKPTFLTNDPYEISHVAGLCVIQQPGNSQQKNPKYKTYFVDMLIYILDHPRMFSNIFFKFWSTLQTCDHMGFSGIYPQNGLILLHLLTFHDDLLIDFFFYTKIVKFAK